MKDEGISGGGEWGGILGRGTSWNKGPDTRKWRVDHESGIMQSRNGTDRSWGWSAKGQAERKRRPQPSRQVTSPLGHCVRHARMPLLKEILPTPHLTQIRALANTWPSPSLSIMVLLSSTWNHRNDPVIFGVTVSPTRHCGLSLHLSALCSSWYL